MSVYSSAQPPIQPPLGLVCQVCQMWPWGLTPNTSRRPSALRATSQQAEVVVVAVQLCPAADPAACLTRHSGGLPQPRLVRDGDHRGHVDDPDGVPGEHGVARLRSVDPRGHLDAELLRQPGDGSVAAERGAVILIGVGVESGREPPRLAVGRVPRGLDLVRSDADLDRPLGYGAPQRRRVRPVDREVRRRRRRSRRRRGIRRSASTSGRRRGTAPSRTPCLVAQAMTSASEMKISGSLHAFANASSAVTQSPWTSLPHIEICCGFTMKFVGAPTRAG